MNFHTAKMVAAKHGKRAIRDTEDGTVIFEERDGTPIFEIRSDGLQALTTYALEVRLGVWRQEAP